MAQLSVVKQLEPLMSSAPKRGRPQKLFHCLVPGCTQTWSGAAAWCITHGKNAPKEEIVTAKSAGKAEGSHGGRQPVSAYQQVVQELVAGTPAENVQETGEQGFEHLVNTADRLQKQAAALNGKGSEKDHEREGTEEETIVISDQHLAEKVPKKRKHTADPVQQVTHKPQAQHEKINSKVMFTYKQYLEFRDNPHVCNCKFKTSDDKIIPVPAIDVINNSAFYADEIADNKDDLMFPVSVPADILELLIKILYDQKLSEKDIKGPTFFDFVIATHNMDFAEILGKLLPYTKKMIEDFDFKTHFLDFLVTGLKEGNDDYDDVCKSFFKELPDEITKEILLEVFLSDHGAELTLQERRNMASLTSLNIQYRGNHEALD